MRRNLDGRVETIFPLENKEDRKKVIQVIKDILRDNTKLRVQNTDGSYKLVGEKEKKSLIKFNYQEDCIEKLNE